MRPRRRTFAPPRAWTATPKKRACRTAIWRTWRPLPAIGLPSPKRRATERGPEQDDARIGLAVIRASFGAPAAPEACPTFRSSQGSSRAQHRIAALHRCTRVRAGTREEDSTDALENIKHSLNGAHVSVSAYHAAEICCTCKLCRAQLNLPERARPESGPFSARIGRQTEITALPC